MAGGPRPGEGTSPGGILDLLALAPARPSEALAKAHAILAAGPAPYEASVAHQAIGMIQREFGDLDAATAELNTAVRLARASRSQERESDVLAALGVALIYRGHSRRGLTVLGTSLTLVSGPPAARVLVRRAAAPGSPGPGRPAPRGGGREPTARCPAAPGRAPLAGR